MANRYKAGIVTGMVWLLSACGGSGGSNDAPADDLAVGSLDWITCEDNSALQCATLQVPMDHADSASEKIDIALNRMPASADAPLGSLLFNPGGPGGSGTQLIEELAGLNVLPAAIVARYHIVGFDPRGVNQSTPIDCREFDLDDIDGYPLNIDDLRQYETDVRDFVAACSDKHGTYLQHLGSEAVADDMEHIRRALQEPTLNFVGYSYGTRLAGIYAQKYPTTTGRVILDASLPPTHGTMALFEAQLEPLEANLTALTQSCGEFTDCDPQAIKAALESRVAQLIDMELEFELGLLALVVTIAVEEPATVALIAEPLFQYLQDFDTAPLLDLALQFDLDDEDDFDSESVARAVICADDPVRPSVEQIEALRQRFNQTSDLFAEIQLAAAAICIGWPEALNPLAEISTRQAPATLVIGGPTDAQTPLIWSEQMAAAIGGRFLRSEHPGHTTVFSGQNACTDDAAIDFLLNGTLPDESVCPVSDSTE